MCFGKGSPCICTILLVHGTSSRRRCSIRRGEITYPGSRGRSNAADPMPFSGATKLPIRATQKLPVGHHKAAPASGPRFGSTGFGVHSLMPDAPRYSCLLQSPVTSCSHDPPPPTESAAHQAVTRISSGGAASRAAVRTVTDGVADGVTDGVADGVADGVTDGVTGAARYS